ncbi:atpF [Wigglesworthia glossinidia endosymbiont of Glossina brevipalpis]|uniref:ATP synthase subunit b n=1 Tax=Wigglesworthia glossinidia brevipalpis TaxID=36870 RepID=ATPF_WIGBR|nr:RecName: Full=ATP synthase subunit b; AltName: Full=ATP synthase F(0) sector subunit b; AltName: Full=ATPase subunit I; AltName: Full=F-type ATPase subunit b; Short=F-ATPase subunit b [Wigglesworthia glossinidia endosymbiont of Glossina brevipalpis]BAC24150.1 atpF [Wigglesworthia glossinidia endosymbiont of Glossina brevipalpis]
MNINATIFGQTIAFFLFVFFCMKYIWPNLISLVEKRRENIAQALNEAKQAKLNLKISKEKAKKRIESAQIKCKNIINEANETKKLLIEEAKKEAIKIKEHIISQGRLDILDEKKRMCEDLKTKISEIIVMSVEKIIESSINKKISDNIIERSISKINKIKG